MPQDATQEDVTTIEETEQAQPEQGGSNDKTGQPQYRAHVVKRKQGATVRRPLTLVCSH